MFTFVLSSSSAPARVLFFLLAAPAESGTEAETAAPSEPAAAEARVAPAPAAEPAKTPWIRRFVPERNMVELGVYGGIFLPSEDHELFEADPNLPDQGYQQLDPVAGAVGGRFAYFPSRFFGLEIEGGAMPGSTRGDDAVTLWTARGHLIGQIGLWRISPFVVAGVGALGVASDREAVGSDVDFAVHVGAGAKMAITRRFAIRLDLRDVIAARRGVDRGITNNGEILLGLSLTLGRKKADPASPPADRDADGFLDRDDRCPDEPGVAPDGCPVRDADGDGFLDPDDACPQEPGVAPDGCPVRDADGDGFLDPDDACPQEPGVAPDGCPIPDSDGDGFLDPDDACPQEPETRNGFEDGDGCPDELPKEVETYTGVIEGIFFEHDKAVIRSKSRPTLDEAVEVLTRYPDIRIEISGHTDDTGNRDYNMRLSKDRAAAVKAYLVDKGIQASRIETRGAGPDEPLDSNLTEEGRAQNRRIEFKILQQ